MEIIEYHEADNREYWLGRIKECDWRAGKYLYTLLSEDRLRKEYGESTRLFLLTDKTELVSFCTLAEKDEIPDTVLAPWVGFVYTFPQYRGKHYFGMLLDRACRQAKNDGRDCVYISTEEIGLYEKYGCEHIADMTDRHGGRSRIYRKDIT